MTTLNLPRRTISYTFQSPGANNGKVASITDSGETISYVYDSLQRLTLATGSGWSQGFAYDGFGNLYNKTATGGAPTWSASIDPGTNRISTLSFDGNGNQTFITTTTGIPDSFNLSYDVSNRLTLAVNAGPSIRSDYGYDAGNKRIWEKRTLSGFVNGEWFYFFGITGQRLARYNFTVTGAAITFTQDNASVWFGGQLVQKINTLGSSFASDDRLGSVGKYLPYGEDKPGATNPTGDNEKFATYTRDAANGLDYADQRWHAQGTGRFLTSDPYQASGGPADPGSWNRYGYVEGDPMNFTDPLGLMQSCPNKDGCQGPGNDPCYSANPPGWCTTPGGGPGLLPKPPEPQQQPGGGGRRGPKKTLKQLIKEALDRAIDHLDDECAEALGFKDSADAINQLNNRTTWSPGDLGLPTYDSTGKWKSGPFAETNQFTRAVTINTQIDWNDPTQQTIINGGVQQVGDLLAGEVSRLKIAGLTTMTSEQLLDLTILHELAHTKIFGGKNPDVLTNEQELWKMCFNH